MSTILRETHGLNLKEQIDEVLKEAIDQYDWLKFIKIKFFINMNVRIIKYPKKNINYYLQWNKLDESEFMLSKIQYWIHNIHYIIFSI